MVAELYLCFRLNNGTNCLDLHPSINGKSSERDRTCQFPMRQPKQHFSRAHPEDHCILAPFRRCLVPSSQRRWLQVYRSNLLPCPRSPSRKPHTSLYAPWQCLDNWAQRIGIGTTSKGDGRWSGLCMSARPASHVVFISQAPHTCYQYYELYTLLAPTVPFPHERVCFVVPMYMLDRRNTRDMNFAFTSNEERWSFFASKSHSKHRSHDSRNMASCVRHGPTPSC